MPKERNENHAANSLSGILAAIPHFHDRVGLPAKDSIMSLTVLLGTFRAGRTPARTFRIIRTNEMDEYEKGAASPQSFAAVALPTGDKFQGTARKADLPGLTYDFYDPPIRVQITGSLFFDMSHATGTRPGPKSLKSRMPVIWEVHPYHQDGFSMTPTPTKGPSATKKINPFRRGLPARDSIVEIKEVGKGKKNYRIIKTKEVDEYEPWQPDPSERQ